MMRQLSTTAGLVIVGVLAVLLLVYVFAGGSTGKADAAPHCTSQQAMDQVKGELFRRAAGVRGTADPGFNAVARYSVVRAGSRLVRRHYPRSDRVTCSGSIALDLPPGAAAIGGRRMLAAPLTYDLTSGPNTGVRLVNLRAADAIVVPLATITSSTSQAQMPLQAPQANGTVLEMSPPQAAHTAGPLSSRAPAREQEGGGATPPRPAAPRESQPPREAAPRTLPALPHSANPPSAPKPRSSAPRPPAVASASPSFNCRYARTRGEIAVCGNPGLAALDREMSAEYYRALSASRPGQRVMLERSRNRFLRYRDSCGSDACIADAYRGRMREIADIMSGG